MTEKSRLLDHAGYPIGGLSSDEQHLPAGVQALIETRINAAISDIREHNRDDLQDLSREHAKKWRFLAIVSFCIAIFGVLINIFTYLYAPAQIAKWITTQVDTKLTEPMLKESADRVMTAKMSIYIDQQLKTLQDRATSLGVSLDNIRSNVETQQAKLTKELAGLSKQLKVQELAIAAKAGSRSSYTQLLALQNDPNQPAPLLKVSLKEIELFFDADRSQLSFQTLVQTPAFKDPGFAVDEVMNILQSDPRLAEAAVNTLSKLKAKGAVRELCRLAEEGEDLRAAARATRALEEITGEKFRPLAFDEVHKWWELNKRNGAYNGDYTGYCNVVEKMYQPPILKKNLEQFIEQLKDTINSDPDALHARCLKAGFLLMLGRDDDAKQLLDDVRGKRNDYYWLYMWDAAAHLNKKDTEIAIELLNKAFEKSPTSLVEGNIRLWNIFAPIRSSERINWPQKKMKESLPTDSSPAPKKL